MRISITASASGQVDEIDGWWREHRPAAAGLFAEELAATLDLLEAMPLVGRRYRSFPRREVRRLLMRATHFHVYYCVEGEAVVVLAIWSALRGYGPPLPGGRP